MDTGEEVVKIAAFIGNELGYNRQDHRGSVGTRLADHHKRLSKIEGWRDGNGIIGAKTMLMIIWKSYLWLWAVGGFVSGWILKVLIDKIMTVIPTIGG